MRVSLRLIPAGIALAALAGSVHATDLVFQPRLQNVAPNSTLTEAVGPNSAFVQDVGVSNANARPGQFANRHDFLVGDGTNTGTPMVFNNNDFFSFSADVKLTGTPDSPRKEAGIRVDNATGGDFLFILDTDGHEVVSFGGPGPFYNFRDHGVPNFNSGDTVNMSIQYGLDPTGATYADGTVQHGVILGAGGVYSPFLPMFNLEEGFLDGSTLGTYLQIANDPNNPDNAGRLDLNNVQFSTTRGGFIPEPGSLALLGAGVLPLLGLRRRRS